MDCVTNLSNWGVVYAIAILCAIGLVSAKLGKQNAISEYAGTLIEINAYDEPILKDLFRAGDYRVQILNKERAVVVLMALSGQGIARVCRFRGGIPSSLLEDGIIRYNPQDTKAPWAPLPPLIA